MSDRIYNDIDSVLIRTVEDEYTPPSELVGICVIGDTLFIDVQSYEETPDTRTLKLKYKVPQVNVNDFLAAIHICMGRNFGTTGFRQRGA